METTGTLVSPWILVISCAVSLLVGFAIGRMHFWLWPWQKACGVACNCIGGAMACVHFAGHACGAPGCAVGAAPGHTHPVPSPDGGSCTLVLGHGGAHRCSGRNWF